MSMYAKYLDYPVGAQEAGTAAWIGGQGFCSSSRLMAGVDDVAVATLEPGEWVLDGSRTVTDGEPTACWSLNRSDDDCMFETPPEIDITFTAPYTATGLTFTFSPSTGQYCSKLRVRWYSGTTLLADTTAEPDDPQWVLTQTVESFDRINIQLLATNHPGHFAKLTQLRIGQLITLDETELTRVQYLAEVDPGMTELSVDEFTLEFNDRHGRDHAPQEHQAIELYVDGGLRAAHYIRTSTREGSHFYTFTTQSILGRLDDDFFGGIYEEAPVAALLTDILGTIEYSLAEDFTAATISGYLPICTRREALQQVALSIGAMVTTQGGYAVRFIPRPDGVASTIPASRIFPGAGVETASRVARVEVVAHSYAAGDETEELLRSEPISGEAVMYTWDAPHYGYAITGGTLVDSGANWVTITAEGEVTLTGKKYIHTTRTLAKANPQALAAERGNVVRVEQATLLTVENAAAALERLYAFYLLRQTLTEEIVVNGQQAGERVVSYSNWGRSIDGFVTRMEQDITRSAVTAAITVVGLELPAQTAVGYAGQMFAAEEVIF